MIATLGGGLIGATVSAAATPQGGHAAAQERERVVEPREGLVVRLGRRLGIGLERGERRGTPGGVGGGRGGGPAAGGGAEPGVQGARVVAELVGRGDGDDLLEAGGQVVLVGA